MSLHSLANGVQREVPRGHDPASDHHTRRSEECHHVGECDSYVVGDGIDGCEAFLIPLGGAGIDGGNIRQPDHPGQCLRLGQGLHASTIAATTQRSVRHDYLMRNLSGRAELAQMDAPANNDATADSRSKGQPHQRVVGTSGPDRCLGEHEGAGVVDERGRNAKCLSHRVAQ